MLATFTTPVAQVTTADAQAVAEAAEALIAAVWHQNSLLAIWRQIDGWNVKAAQLGWRQFANSLESVRATLLVLDSLVRERTADTDGLPELSDRPILEALAQVNAYPATIDGVSSRSFVEAAYNIGVDRWTAFLLWAGYIGDRRLRCAWYGGCGRTYTFPANGDHAEHEQLCLCGSPLVAYDPVDELHLDSFPPIELVDIEGDPVGLAQSIDSYSVACGGRPITDWDVCRGHELISLQIQKECQRVCSTLSFGRQRIILDEPIEPTVPIVHRHPSGDAIEWAGIQYPVSEKWANAFQALINAGSTGVGISNYVDHTRDAIARLQPELRDLLQKIEGNKGYKLRIF